MGLFDNADNDIMTGSNDLLRIFWPSDAPQNDLPGTIVGWRNSELDILVVAVLQDVEVRGPQQRSTAPI